MEYSDAITLLGAVVEKAAKDLRVDGYCRDEGHRKLHPISQCAGTFITSIVLYTDSVAATLQPDDIGFEVIKLIYGEQGA